MGDPHRCWDPAHGSFSKDRAFDECQYRYHEQHVQRSVSDPMGAPAIVGLAVDSYLTDALMGRTPKTTVEYLTETAQEVSSPSMVLDWPYMEAKADALIELAMEEVVPTYEGRVAYTQLELHFEVPGIDRIYHAHLDLVLEDGSLIDWKTSEKRLGEGRVHNDQQLTRYALAMSLAPEFGFIPREVGLDGLIYANPPADIKAANPKARKPWWDRQRSQRTQAELDAHMEQMRVREAHRKFTEENGLYQTNGRASLFACGFCPVKPICPAWPRQEAVA